jgi:hypothetical protein
MLETKQQVEFILHRTANIFFYSDFQTGVGISISLPTSGINKQPYISAIVPGGSADQEGAIREGDRIVRLRSTQSWFKNSQDCSD